MNEFKTFIITILFIIGWNVITCEALVQKFQWVEYFQSNRTNDLELLYGQQSAFYIVGQPVYVSLTTVRARLYSTYSTIKTILNGTVLPTHIFLFISEMPYIVDQGISKEHLVGSGLDTLAQTHAQYFSIIYTNNIGPHRKLLPLLAEKWKEDCVIITIDDHTEYPLDIVSSLLDYYIASGRESVVALRARRIGLCFENDPWKTAPYPRKGFWPVAVPGRQEMLLLPTGSGGVLYRPKFFAEYVFDDALRNFTRTSDDITFRLGTMGKGVKVVTGCNSMTSFQDTGERMKCPQPVVIRNLKKDENKSPTTSTTATVTTNIRVNTTAEMINNNNNNSINKKNVRERHIIPNNIHQHSTSDKTQPTRQYSSHALANTSSSTSSLLPVPPEPIYPDPWGASLWQINQKAESTSTTKERGGGGGSGIGKSVWAVSLQYLVTTNQLYFNRIILQKYAPIERSACRLHIIQDGFLSSAANKLGSAFIALGMMDKDNSIIDDTKTLIQSAYDHECGIQFCHRS